MGKKGKKKRKPDENSVPLRILKTLKKEKKKKKNG
jgi:hypothetical protein